MINKQTPYLQTPTTHAVGIGLVCVTTWSNYVTLTVSRKTYNSLPAESAFANRTSLAGEPCKFGLALAANEARLCTHAQGKRNKC